MTSNYKTISFFHSSFDNLYNKYLPFLPQVLGDSIIDPGVYLAASVQDIYGEFVT